MRRFEFDSSSLGKSRPAKARPSEHLLVKQGYAFEQAVRVAERLGVSQAEVASVLGISESKLYRYKEQPFDLDTSDRLYRLSTLLDLAEQAIGDPLDARRWMNEFNPFLGAVPTEMVGTTPGYEEVSTYLQQIGDGVVV
jgi:putative toxin-antitoxin system antitoxin component (TIGR02293 family)